MIASKTEQRCIDCKAIRLLECFPVSNIHKLKVTRRCVDCQRLKNSKPTSGQVSRKILREIKRNKKHTPQQERRKEEEKLYKKVRKKILKKQLDEHGFYFCETCGYSTAEKETIQIHHILHRSLCHNVDVLHSVQNLIPLCFRCHKQVHSHHRLNDALVNKRFINNKNG